MDFCLISVPFGLSEEPEILRYENPSACPIGADVRQVTATVSYGFKTGFGFRWNDDWFGTVYAGYSHDRDNVTAPNAVRTTYDTATFDNFFATAAPAFSFSYTSTGSSGVRGNQGGRASFALGLSGGWRLRNELTLGVSVTPSWVLAERSGVSSRANGPFNLALGAFGKVRGDRPAVALRRLWLPFPPRQPVLAIRRSRPVVAAGTVVTSRV